MASRKVAEWIRKRTMPRKSATRRRSKENCASEPVLPRETEPESWSSTSGSGNGASGGGAPQAHSKSLASAFLSALLRWRPRVNVLAVLWEQVVYHMMWLVESVVMVARLCFFLMRFGFKQL